MRRRLPLALWVDLAVKVALVGLLLLAVAARRAAVRGQGDDRTPARLPARGRPRPGRLVAPLPTPRPSASVTVRPRRAPRPAVPDFAEHFTFIRNSPEEETAYTDTVSDLALGLTGSVLAAALTATVLWRRPGSNPA